MTELIIALDFSNKDELFSFLQKFQEQQLFVKVGMELFYKEGPGIVKEIKNRGHKVFLDLKLHDIPNTVERAMKNLAQLGVDMVNVHAAGGLEMMKAAKKGYGNKGKIIAVSQLTSTSEENMHKEQLVQASLTDSVLNYAQLAYQAGLDGMVCSALEVEFVHKHVSSNFLCITPGIRPHASQHGDQKRVVTPYQAKQLGSHYIVVGRPITQSKNPKEAYLEIIKELEQN